MIRIVAGAAGGRRLVVPPGRGTRPTSDRAREGLFSTLVTLADLDGARVLDLYAGSGALGLEALSRGAVGVTFVESAAAALAALRANLTALDVVGAEVIGMPVERFLDGPASAYDVVLADPPYALDVAPVLRALLRWRPGLAVVERSARNPAPWPAGWAAVKQRRYGDVRLWYGRPH